MTSPSNDNSRNAVVLCAVCSKPAVAEYAPFCSKRCADIDLHRWLSGAYAVPGEDGDPEALDELISRSDEGS